MPEKSFRTQHMHCNVFITPYLLKRVAKRHYQHTERHSIPPIVYSHPVHMQTIEVR